MCAIEKELKDFPSFWIPGAEHICGAYCITECDKGFPYLIMNEWKECLTNTDRSAVADKDSSDILKVGGSRNILLDWCRRIDVITQ